MATKIEFKIDPAPSIDSLITTPEGGRARLTIHSGRIRMVAAKPKRFGIYSSTDTIVETTLPLPDGLTYAGPPSTITASVAVAETWDVGAALRPAGVRDWAAIAEHGRDGSGSWSVNLWIAAHSISHPALFTYLVHVVAPPELIIAE
ncbi:hypothetical protein ACN27F_02870 [Solwaraspora sp. WMMB335]|uniref:hypothetical protein n=1 Tax=Solwaraspora sp. WMMB335 TaxID=3404118 RepID=UPI003B93ED2D